MVALLVSWFAVLIVFYTFGDVIVSVYNSVIKKEERYSFIDTILLGMCSSTVLIMLTSFFVPSNYVVLCGLVLFSVAYWLANKKRFSKIFWIYSQKIRLLPKAYIAIILIGVVLILLHATLAPVWVDTSYYHIQNIMWNDQYHVVPGLANLQPRFGFNSNYYLLCSVFGLKPLFGQYIFGVHTFCLALVFVWLVYKTSISKVITTPVVAFSTFFLFVFVYKLHITSPSSDLLPNLLILYLFLKVIFDAGTLKKYPLLFLAVPVFCLTLKLSSFAVCLFSAYVLWLCIREKSYKKLSFFLIYASLIFIVWCARTTIITGYVIFPYPALDIFSFDWKVPAQYVIDQKEYIQSFARVDNIPMQEALAMNISEWLPKWWQVGMFYYFPVLNKVLFILSVASVPLMVILFFVSKKYKSNYLYLSGIWLIALGGFIFWLFSAPDFRFAYGFIIPLALLPFIVIFSILENKLSLQPETVKKCCLILSFVIVLLIGSQVIRWVYYQRDEKQSFFALFYKPEPVSRTKELRGLRYEEELRFVPYQINNVTLYTPTIETHCYDCELPCSLDFTGGLEMRGETLQEGFRTKSGAPYRKTY